MLNTLNAKIYRNAHATYYIQNCKMERGFQNGHLGQDMGNVWGIRGIMLAQLFLPATYQHVLYPQISYSL